MRLPELEDEQLLRSIGLMRRAMLRDGLMASLAAMTDTDLSMPQVVVLFLLDDMGELSATALAERTGRSVSAMSRLLDQLVRRRMIQRRESDHDRRFKFFAIAEEGRTFLAAFEKQRADAQLAVMKALSPEERAQVMRGMALLAEAAKRRKLSELSEPTL
ncbi:transcriptional repressor MprA [compost metagenome]